MALPRCAETVKEQLPTWAVSAICAGKMTSVAIKVTPTVAAVWLEGNIHNRPLREGSVRELMQAILDGKWVTTHQGIAFDPSSILIDGQNRLWAVLQAEKSVTVQVTFNEPAENRGSFDLNGSRTPTDRVRLEGYTWATNVHTGIIRALHGTCAKGVNKMRTDQLTWYLTQYSDGLQFISNIIKGRRLRGVITATTLTPCVRAFYKHGVDHTRLSQFVEVLCTGVSNGSADSSVILLRNLLLRLKASRSREAPEVIYGRVENALSSFLKREPMRILKSVDKELFVLPHEKSGKAPAKPPELLKPMPTGSTQRKA